ncbi:MAG: type II secretory pathway protein LspH [Candidatus Woesebacteria bacterium GW2011_GWA2_40_7]|uniref:Type II secretory pathway protein LspH n=3 Tax=Candidatus Woeseibacteriota TaxID=1752722 RepID=A0A0G0XXC2_9BACT|nr:MAG: type II secretory pathway protein LspH [Candidatus Woesebacteria bacterium GW2011_GWB1_39_10]KKR73016.1 MAG: type II secretory pathway protein LspH [Candidatus Woesebacteria bacterium GW2011_GWA2_40_7]KKR92582.1 MAG: type II secretory pathway protein LspH [Candidatus Woesebacteria bacterium GW2011_GWA1_41_13b]
MSAQYTKYNIQNTSAYTLIEILVGLTIIGMLFGFGFTSFRDFSRRQAVGGVGKLVVGDLRLAQEQALSGQKPIDAKCDPPNNLSGFTFTVSSSSQYLVAANCSGGPVTVKTVNMPDGIILSTPSPNPIEFKVLGHGTNLVSGATAVVTISQVGINNTLDVIVSSSGEIK